MTERKIVRCHHCDLNQYATPRGLCRRCRISYSGSETQVSDPVVKKHSAPRRSQYDFSGLIRSLRKEYGYTFMEMEKLTSISHSNLCYLENGRNMPNVLHIPLIAKVFGMSAREFVEMATLS